MSYDDCKTRTPDDDPDGAEADYRWHRELCPDCKAAPDEPCLPECGCEYCRRREALERDARAAGVTVEEYRAGIPSDW